MLTVVGLCVAIDIAFCAVMRLRRFRSWRPRPVPAPRLSPAVVQLLLHHTSLPFSAVEHTVFALARAGKLELTRLNEGRQVPVRLAMVPRTEEAATQEPVEPHDVVSDVPEAEPLTGPEALVLQRIQRRRAGLGVVPLAALGGGDGSEYSAWWRRFESAVRAEAYDNGLVWRAAEVREWAAGTVVALLVGVLLFSGYLRDGHSLPAAMAWTLLTGPILMMLVHKLTYGPRLTSAGRQAARWWRTNGTAAPIPSSRAREQALFVRPVEPLPKADPKPAPLPDAAATPTPARAPWPSSGDPVSDHRVWSAHGGRWRLLEVGSPSRWGLPSQLAALTVLSAVTGVWLGLLLRHLPTRDVAAAVSVPTLGWVWATARWIPAYRQLRRFPAQEPFDATVAKLWQRQPPPDHKGNPSRTLYYCALDDGRSARAWSFPLSEETWNGLAVGDLVRAECDSRRRRLTALASLHRPAPEPGRQHSGGT